MIYLHQILNLASKNLYNFKFNSINPILWEDYLSSLSPAFSSSHLTFIAIKPLYRFLKNGNQVQKKSLVLFIGAIVFY